MFMLIVFGFTVPDRSGLFRILVPPDTQVWARCSWSQVSAFSISHWLHSKISSYAPPPALPSPPFSVLIRLPSAYYLMPSILSSPIPPFILARVFRTPLLALSGQPHIPLLFPVRRLHWFHHSLCLQTCSPHHPSVLQTNVSDYHPADGILMLLVFEPW